MLQFVACNIPRSTDSETFALDAFAVALVQRGTTVKRLDVCECSSYC